jgi:hypothetical protein
MEKPPSTACSPNPATASRARTMIVSTPTVLRMAWASSMVPATDPSYRSGATTSWPAERSRSAASSTAGRSPYTEWNSAICVMASILPGPTDIASTTTVAP